MRQDEAGWLGTLAEARESVQQTSASGRVAAALRERIIEGDLRPGTRLSEVKIGHALGVSRNTLREAFQLLTHERLVVHRLNRGVFVRSLEADDVRDLYRFRRMLEVAAIRQASLGTPDLSGLRAAVTEGERAARDEDWARLGSANMHFHRALAGMAGSRRVEEAMEQALAEMRLVFARMEDPHAFYTPYLAENQQLLALLDAGRHAEAEQALTTYLHRAETQLLGRWGDTP